MIIPNQNKAEVRVRSRSEATKRYEQELLDKEFGKSMTQRVYSGNNRTVGASLLGINQNVQYVDPQDIDYKAIEQSLNQKISSAAIPLSGRAEILKQGRENPYLQAARLREDRQYGIDSSAYSADSKSSGGTRRRTVFYDTRGQLIRNAQMRGQDQENRRLKESAEKEQRIVGTQIQGAPRKSSLLASVLGSEEGRFTGL